MVSNTGDGIGNSYNNWNNQGTGEVKHKPHLPTLDASQTDKLESSTSTYQEEYIPAADNPDLPDPQSNPDSTPLPSEPKSPKAAFQHSMQSQAANLSPQAFATLQKANPNILTSAQAQNFLHFAMSNPNSKAVTPEVRQLLQQMTDNATAQTKQQFSLGNNWNPPQPNAEAENQELANANNQNFEELVNDLCSNPQDKAAIELANYHPELGVKLTPNQQQILNSAQQGANAMTHIQEGLPDSVNLPKSSAAFDAKLSGTFTSNFESMVNQLVQNGSISAEEGAELKTLMNDPSANVPDKAKLASLASNLQGKAMSQLQQQFNLPKQFQLPSMAKNYYEVAQGRYQNDFEKNVKGMQNKLSTQDMNTLLATKGLSGNNLPPELQNLFEQLKTATVNDIIDKMGLPKDWEPKKTKGIDGVGKKEKAEASESSGTEEAEEETSGTSQTSQTGQAGKVSAFSAISGPANSTSQTQNTNEAADVADVNAVAPRDNALAGQMISYMADYANEVQHFTASWLTGPDKNNIADAMLIVSEALSTSRNDVYNLEAADANSNAVVSQAQKDINLDKTAQQWAEFQKEQNEHPKECFLFKILDDIKIPPFQQLAELAQLYVQTVSWIMDTITGGALSAICQAANVEPVSKNPLQTMGILNASQAGQMDFAVQIIVMVAEMAVEACLGQGELIAVQAARFATKAGAKGIAKAATEKATEIATTKGLAQTVAISGQDAAAHAAADGVSKGLSREEIEVQVKDALLKQMKDQLDYAAQSGYSQAVVSNVEKVTSQAAEMIAKEATKQALIAAGKYTADGVLETAGDALKAAKSAMGDAISPITDTVTAGAESAVASTADALETINVQIANTLRKLIEKRAENLNETARAIKKAAAKAATDSVTGGAAGMMTMVMTMQAVVGGVMGFASGIMEMRNDLKKAEQVMEIAQLEASIATLGGYGDAMSKVVSQTTQIIQQLSTWVQQINQEQSKFWQQNQIHYVA